MNAADRTWSLLLTPPGTGAIGVIRILGPQALSVIDGVFQATDGVRFSEGPTNQLRHGWLSDDRERIDEVVVSRSSIHGELAIDVTAHGGVRVIERILEALERHGAPLGKVTKTNRPIWPAANLIEREALIVLAEARSERVVQFIAWQREHLAVELGWIASLCREDPERAQSVLRSMILSWPATKMLVEGATIAVVGPTNSGKSTLFNRLLGRSAAVVSGQPGTTRDWVSAPAEIEGIPVTLLDTAGDRSTSSALEQEAIGIGQQIGARADLRLVVFDGSRAFDQDEWERWEAQRTPGKRLLVANKLDRGAVWANSSIANSRAAEELVVQVSAKTGAGVDRLAERISASLGLHDRAITLPALFTHRQIAVAGLVLSALAAGRAAACDLIERRLIGLRPA